MNKMICMVSLVVLFTTTQALAEEQKPASPEVFTKEQTEGARQALQGLGQVFGITPDKDQNSGKDQAKDSPREKKSMADVADKAVEYAAKFVAYIANALEQAAPTVMKILVKQQYAQAIGDLVVPWGLFWMVVVATYIVRRAFDKIEKDNIANKQHSNGLSEEQKEERLWATRIIPAILCIIAGTWGFVRLSDSIQLLINPEYYAIRDLLRMLLNKGNP